MEDYMQFSAKTKSEAITKACMELGTSSDQLDITVVSEGSSGFFGIGSKPAIIKVRRKGGLSEEEEIKNIVKSVSLDSIHEETSKKEKNRQNKPARQAENKEKQPKQPKQQKQQPKETKEVKETVETPASEPVSEPKAEAEVKEKPHKEKKEKPAKEKQPKQPREPKEAKEPKEKQPKPQKAIEILTDEEEIKDVENRAVVFLKEVFDAMELGEVEIKSVYNREEGSLDVDFEGEDMGLLIGKRGQTLDSLQYLTSLVVNKGKDTYIRVKLDTEDYRRRRKETLENLARGIAAKVKKTHKAVVLEPMNPYERRIIHSALQGNRYVETISEGEEPYRHIVVKMKK
ncbi:MAG: protein jag [Oscillospiraceae bacterium]|nr:protein jag [Oscillospiraceae bacterium]